MVFIKNLQYSTSEAPLFVQHIEAKLCKTNMLECMAAGSPKPKLMAGNTFVETPLHFFSADNQLLIIMETQTQDSDKCMREMSNTLGTQKGTGARCSSVVRAFAHGAMNRRIDPSWGGPIVLFLVPASAP